MEMHEQNRGARGACIELGQKRSIVFEVPRYIVTNLWWCWMPMSSKVSKLDTTSPCCNHQNILNVRCGVLCCTAPSSLTISKFEWRVFLVLHCTAELSRVEMSPSAVMITVDVCLNSHWTDLVCGVSDTQLFETADALRTRFNTECKSTSHTNSASGQSSVEKKKS